MDLNAEAASVIDDRIAAIMLALSTNDRAVEHANSGDKKVDPAPPAPPATLEEYIQIEGLADWPEFITSEYPLTHDADFILGTKDDILEALKEAAPLNDQLSLLCGLEDRVLGLEEKLMKYASFILTDKPRTSRIAQGMFYSNADKVFITEAPPPESTRKKTDVLAGALLEKKKKDVNFCTFPGFRKKELTELPAQLEAPQLLHRVTKAQNFKRPGLGSGFAKFWKKIFLSEASVAIVQDLFWWMFLKMFRSTSIDSSQDMLFDRLADSFAALFFSIHNDMRDKIFKVYPDMLAQAMFTIFNEAFPESRRMFGPLFKQEIVNYCWELTSGVRPPPGTWKSWDVDRLMSDTDGDDLGSKYSKFDKPTYDFDGLYKMIASMNAAEEVLNGEVDPVKAAAEERDLAMAAIVKRVPPRESVQSGPGPKVEKSLFSLTGLSPLMAHFLSAKQLRESAEYGTKVRRTEVVSLPPPAPTYQEIIREAQLKVKERKADHERFCKEKTAEILQIEKKKNRLSREIEKIKDDIKWMRMDGQDLRLVANTLVSKLSDRHNRSQGEFATQAADGGFKRDHASDYDSDESGANVNSGTVPSRAGSGSLHASPADAKAAAADESLQRMDNEAVPMVESEDSFSL